MPGILEPQFAGNLADGLFGIEHHAFGNLCNFELDIEAGAGFVPWGPFESQHPARFHAERNGGTQRCLYRSDYLGVAAGTKNVHCSHSHEKID